MNERGHLCLPLLQKPIMSAPVTETSHEAALCPPLCLVAQITL